MDRSTGGRTRTTTRYRCTPGTVTRDRDEHLCDLAASEMLLPAAHIRPRLTGPLRLESAEALATDFDASLEASCRRIVTLWPAPALLVGLELRTSPRQKPGAEPRLRVASQHANGDWPYAPKHKSLQPGHALYDVLAQGTITCETDLDDLWPPDRRGRLTIHAGHYPWTDRDGIHHDRVLVLASEPGRITP